MRLNTIVIDDDRRILERYDHVIRRLGHAVQLFSDIDTGLRHLYSSPVDVLFLDNHLKTARGDTVSGLDYVPEIKERKRWCHVVLASGKSFESDMIKAVVDYRIEYFVVNPPEAEEIQKALVMISRAREREEEVIEMAIAKISETAALPGGFIDRLLNRRTSISVKVTYGGDTGERYLLTPMEHMAEVHIGGKETIEVARRVAVEHRLKVSSQDELSVSLKTSEKFLLSPLGGEVKTALRQVMEKSETSTLASEISEKMEIALHDQEIDGGAVTKRIFGGVVYRRHTVHVASQCSECDYQENVELSCFVPEAYETTQVLIDKYQRVISDGRDGYAVWRGARALLT